MQADKLILSNLDGKFTPTLGPQKHDAIREQFGREALLEGFLFGVDVYSGKGLVKGGAALGKASLSALFKSEGRDVAAVLKRATTSTTEVVSFGSPGPNTQGVRVITAGEFAYIQKTLEKQGLTVYRTNSPTDSLHRVLESGKVQIGLRNDATVYNFLHEWSHHVTYLESKMTPARWNALSETARERLVFNHLQKHYWGYLTKDERRDAIVYAWKKGVHEADEQLMKVPYLGGGDKPGRIAITPEGKIQRFAPE